MMEFRPCIDIHNGKVKQIVGGSLRDEGNHAFENFVSENNADFYAKLYKKYNLKGGHIILLNKVESEYYELSKQQAMNALKAYPNGMQIGGGINADNAGEFLDAGASHVIVTSYVFSDGHIHYGRLDKLKKTVGKKHLVLDLSCRKTAEGYMIATDRWQKITQEMVTGELMDALSEFCDEFMIHAVDAEGKSRGIEKELVRILGDWEGCPITYAGGVHNMDDLSMLRELGNNRLNVTIGSALDLFGGEMQWDEVLRFIREE